MTQGTTLVFLDTETTGTNPDTCEVWEIGAILRQPNGPDVEYAWQIRPVLHGAQPTGLRIGRYYQRLAPDLHRASPGTARRLVHPDMELPETDQYTTDSEVAAELAILLDGAYVVGAVPWFDEQFIQRFLGRNNQAATNHYHLIDVENLAAGHLGIRPPWDFDQILSRYRLTYDEADRHTALGDARMARDLFDRVYVDGLQPTR